jgi:hypothetical protein
MGLSVCQDDKENVGIWVQSLPEFRHIIITPTDVSQPEAFHNRGRTDVAFN